jgi:hypothetical protein
MSYSTYMTGRITITPALTWMDIKGSKHFRSEADGVKGWSEFPDLVFEIEAEDRPMPEGVLVIERAVAIVPASEHYATRGDYAESELRAIVKTFGAAREFEGVIEGLGEGDGTIEGIDIWRLRVENGTVRKIEPRLVWEW